jgi:hypothetical protein
MPRQPLKVVTDEKPPTRKPKGVVDAADSGDRLELLLAMRSRVARAVQDANTPSRDLAALTRRLLDIANDIAAIEHEREEDGGSDVPDERFDSSAV